MSKFENIQKMNNKELNPNEVSVDVGIEKKLKSELTSKPEQPKLSPEEELKNLENETEAKQEKINKLTESVEETRSKLNKIREKIGLPPIEEDPPSVFSEKDELERLKEEQEILEKQRVELTSRQEKEQLIREIKEKILQEKLNEVFKEFEKLKPFDFESILKSGKTPEGRNVESKSMGLLEPETAQSLAKAFREGVKLLPKILESLPELLKKIDEDLTKEATERVDKMLEEEEKQKEEKLEKEKSKEKSETTGDKTPPDEEKPETNPIESSGIENLKA